MLKLLITALIRRPTIFHQTGYNGNQSCSAHLRLQSPHSLTKACAPLIRSLFTCAVIVVRNFVSEKIQILYANSIVYLYFNRFISKEQHFRTRVFWSSDLKYTACFCTYEYWSLNQISAVLNVYRSVQNIVFCIQLTALHTGKKINEKSMESKLLLTQLGCRSNANYTNRLSTRVLTTKTEGIDTLRLLETRNEIFGFRTMVMW